MPTNPRPPSARVGLKQIASDLGVSVSLVSKVLSGRLGTSGATPEKAAAIRERAQLMGYRKNLLAQALRTGRQNVVAVYVHQHGLEGSAITDAMLRGVAEEAIGLHQRLLIHYYSSAAEFHAAAPQVYANAVDGVIIAGLPHRELVDDLRAMQQQGMPVVTILDAPLSDEFPNMGMDQASITKRSTLHLIDQGCRRIAAVRCTDVERTTPQSQDRYAGYRAALQERGLAFDPQLVVDVPTYAHESGTLAGRTLLDRKVAFDGVVGQTDQHAVGVMNLLIQNGRRVPEDVKVIGLDDSPFCQFTIVPLSSMSQEFAPRGAAAMRALMDVLGGQPRRSELFDPVVKPRASTGG